MQEFRSLNWIKFCVNFFSNLVVLWLKKIAQELMEFFFSNYPIAFKADNKLGLKPSMYQVVIAKV